MFDAGSNWPAIFLASAMFNASLISSGGDAVLNAPLATADDNGLRHGGQVGAFAGEHNAEICIAAHDADATQLGSCRMYLMLSLRCAFFVTS